MKTQIEKVNQVLHLRHPEYDAPAVAEVVGNWMENGRYTGYELRFTGEGGTRHLRFAEIRALQGVAPGAADE